MDIIPEIHRRLRKMFLLESGTPKATGDGPAMTEVTAGVLIDVVKAVGDFFKEHDDGKVFRGWVDKQQARGWVLADLRGCPLLEPGTARAEKGTARGVGNEIAKEAGVQAPKVSQAGKDARKRVRTQSDAPADTDVDAAAEEARKRARSVKAKDVGLPMEQLRRMEPAVAPGSAQRRCFECARRAPGSAQTLMYVTVRVHSTSIYKYNLNTLPVIIFYHLLSISEAISRV